MSGDKMCLSSITDAPQNPIDNLFGQFGWTNSLDNFLQSAPACSRKACGDFPVTRLKTRANVR